MSNVVYVTILAIVLAVCCGIAFSLVYPEIPIDGTLSGLFAFVGVATALVILALCWAIFGGHRGKSAL